MLEQSDEADHGPSQDNTARSTSATKGWFDRSLRALNTWPGGTLSAGFPPVENVATAARAAEVTGHSRASFVEPMPAKSIERNRHVANSQLGFTLASLHGIPGAALVGTAASPGDPVAESAGSGEAVAGSGGASGLSSMNEMKLNDETPAQNNNEMQKQSEMLAVNPTTDDDWYVRTNNLTRGDTAGAYQYPMNATADGASVAAYGKMKGIGGGPSGIHPSSWTAWTSRFVNVNSDGTWELNQEAEKLSSKNRRKLLFKLNYKPSTSNMTDDDWDTM